MFDPTDLANYVIPTGKQTRIPEHIFYRPCSGIWQTVWLESAPAERISQLDVRAAADGSMTVNVHSSSNRTGSPVEVQVFHEDGRVLAKGSGAAGQKFTFNVPGVQPWSPDAPTLYNLTVTMGQDKVASYTGFRTVEKGEVDGIVRPMLNGEFVFQFATLDQGFWPDGIYTPPSYEAMIFDLQALKKLGFNTIRKHVSVSRIHPGNPAKYEGLSGPNLCFFFANHVVCFSSQIKVEPDLFYWACDSLGLMVIQDMPSMSPRVPAPNAAQQQEWERQFNVLINEHLSYTCIVTWVSKTFDRQTCLPY